MPDGHGFTIGDNLDNITEDGVALAFTAEYAEELRYCHHAQHWYVWTGAYWRREETKLAFSWAREICRRYAVQAPADDQKKISKAAFCASVERFAQADRTFAVTAETWDRDPWLLGTPGGTVNLKTGELRTAAKADLITKHTACTPAPPGSAHPEWTAFLDAATAGDKELQLFLQRLVGYMLTGRHPYGKPFTFMPRFKIMLVGNHAPRLKGRSKAMERRMRIAPFKHKPEKPDHGLKERLRKEMPAILRWCIDGCLMWQKERLGTCPAVAKETDTYFAQQDHFGRWMAERCNLGTDTSPMSERPSKLLTDFLSWAKESGETSVTSGEFRELIERTAGLKYATVKGVQWVRGLGLKPTEAQQAKDDETRKRYGDDR